MNTMTLSVPLISDLKHRIHAGLHLHVLCVLNEYLTSDPVMAAVMIHTLTEHASRHASDKLPLLKTYRGTVRDSLHEDEHEKLQALLSSERERAETRRQRVVSMPHRSRRPSELSSKNNRNSDHPNDRSNERRKRGSHLNAIPTHAKRSPLLAAPILAAGRQSRQCRRSFASHDLLPAIGEMASSRFIRPYSKPRSPLAVT